MSKMYLWVLTLATKSEPTLIGQLALSLQMISILDVASSSIALWLNHRAETVIKVNYHLNVSEFDFFSTKKIFSWLKTFPMHC
jgi:hypothetical protein